MFKRALLVVMAAAAMISFTACVLEFDNAGSMVSGALKEYRETIDMSDKYKAEEPLKLDLEMKMAKGVLDSTEEKLVDARFSYNSEALKPEFKADEDEISIRNSLEGYGLGKAINNWDIKVTDKVPLEVEIRADASEVKLNTGDMQIKSIDVELNASSAKMYFEEQSKINTDKFKLSADASSVDIYGAGNLSFDAMDIDVDASKVAFDLSGFSKKNGKVRIDADASSVKLRLPEDVDIRIVIDRYEISSVNINNDRILSRSEKEYISQDYGNASRSIEIFADLNVTSLTID